MVVGFLEKAVEASPGDDPLLLKGLEIEGENIVWPKVESWQAGLGQDLHTGPENIASSSRYPAHSQTMRLHSAPVTADDLHNPQNLADAPGDQYDPGQVCFSDDDTDAEDSERMRDDTFVHVLSRQRPPSRSTSPAGVASFEPSFRSHSKSPAALPCDLVFTSIVRSAPVRDHDRLDRMLEQARMGLAAATQELEKDAREEDAMNPQPEEPVAQKFPIGFGDRQTHQDQISAVPETEESDRSTYEGQERDVREAEDGEWSMSTNGQDDPSPSNLSTEIMTEPVPLETIEPSLTAVGAEEVKRAECASTTPATDERVEADHPVVEEDEINQQSFDELGGDLTVEAECGEWSLSEPELEQPDGRNILGANQSPAQEASDMSDDDVAECEAQSSTARSEEEDEELQEDSEKIVIQVIDRGIVKLEDNQDSDTPRSSKETPDSDALAFVSSVNLSSLYPSLASLPILANTSDSAQSSTLPLSPAVSVPSQSQPLVYRYGNAPAIEAMLRRRNSSSSGPARPSEGLSQEFTLAEGFSTVPRPNRSLHDDLASFTATVENEEADQSMRSVVEVSSLDPRAAARVAAILKLVGAVQCYSHSS